MNTHKKITDFFVLNNYDRVKELTLAEWTMLIGFRIESWHKLKFFDFKKDNITISNEKLEGSYDLNEVTYWDFIKKYGITEYDDRLFQNKNKALEKIRKFLPKEFDSENFAIGGVQQLTEFDLMQEIFNQPYFDELLQDFNEIRFFQYNLIKKNKFYVLSEVKKRAKREIELRKKYKDFIKKQHFGFNYEFIKIDLSASDEQLKENFSDWLFLQRKSKYESRPKRITQKDFDDWTAMKILPYFDLITLSKIYGLNISNHLIGNILFPDELEVDVAERIRKVTKQKTEKVFSLGVLDILCAQIKEEYPTE